MHIEDMISGIFVVIMLTIMIGTMIQFGLSIEEVIVEGDVVDYQLYDNYVRVYFDTGEIYNINYHRTGYGGGVLDFTDNSTLCLELQKTECWITPNPDDVWGIITFIKMPIVK